MANKAASLAAAIALGSGCATARSGRVGYLGMEMCPATEGILLPAVAPGSPAERGGLRGGDLLTAYSGRDLAAAENRKALLWAIRGGSEEGIVFSVRRGGKALTLKAAPKLKESHPSEELTAALAEEIISGRRVSVAVVVTQIRHSKPEFFQSAAALEAWKEGTRVSLQNLFEGMLLKKWYQRCGNFGVVDREKTQQILDELKFQMTGAVSPETARQVGKMTGASHLLFVSQTRFQLPSGLYEDDINARLVAVESDALLASVRLRQAVPAK